MLVDQGFFWLMFCAGGFLLFAGIGLMYWLMAKSQSRQFNLPDTDNWEEIVIETKTYRPRENSDARLDGTATQT
jgi:hypothetical protein